MKTLLLLGATASGKTSFAVQLAEKLPVEIIGVDSRQVYRGLDIGSGKDISEYERPSGRKIPYHLIDIVEPDEVYTLAEFLRDARTAAEKITENGHLPFFVGGTALYLHALLKKYTLSGGAPEQEEREQLNSLELSELQDILSGLDPDCEILKNEPNNRYRIIRKIETLRVVVGQPERTQAEELADISDMEFLVMGVFRERHEIRSRIEQRLDERLEQQNMLDEACRLHDECGVSWERLEFFGLEYREMALHLQGKISYQEMRDSLLTKIHRFAKRQDSWFRKFERDGIPIHWFKPDEVDAAASLSQDFLNGMPLDPPKFRLADKFYGPVQPRESGARQLRVKN